MRVFVTGATGFIGMALVPELISAGHKVLGLTRSDVGAQALIAAGAEVHRGSLEDLDSLRNGAKASDAVIHLAFNHDFSNFEENCKLDRGAINALGSALEGSGRLLIVTSGTGMVFTPGRPATESDPPNTPFPRVESERVAAAFADRGVRIAIMRLSQIHDTAKQGLVSYAIRIAREKGVAAYVGEGRTRWPAAALFDTAHLYRLALEKTNGLATYHAVAEEGVSARDIAEVIGRGLNVPAVSISPEEAPGHFGWLSHFVTLDLPASSAQTRQALGWNPTGPSLITDLNNMNYSQA